MISGTLLFLFGSLTQGPLSEDPAEIVRRAALAIEGDSTARLATIWRQRLSAHPADPSAILGLATLARLSYDYSTAERGYQRLLSSEQTPPDRWAAHARLGQAWALRVRALPAAADWFTRAAEDARSVGDPGAEAEALVVLAALRARTTGLAPAEALFSRAGALLALAGPRVEALYRCSRAAVFGRSGAAESMADAVSGEELAGRAGERRVRAMCLHVQAGIWMARGQQDSAVRLFGEAEREERSARDRAALAATLQWRGWAVRSMGDYARARRDLLNAVHESEVSGNHSALAWALNNLAALSLTFGDAATGAAYATRAAVLFEAQGDLWGLTTTRGIQGDLAVLAGDRVAARAAYRDALARAAAQGNSLRVLINHAALGQVEMDDGDLEAAARELEIFRRMARRHGVSTWEQHFISAIVRLLLRRGDLVEAEREVRAALRGTDTPPRRYELAVLLAAVHSRRERIDSAQAVLNEAGTQLDRWRGALSDRELRVHLFALEETQAGFPTVLAGLVEHGRAGAALEAAERRRARELLDRLTLARSLVEAPGARPAAPPGVSAAAVSAAVPDDRTALLEYVAGRGGEPSVLLLATRAGVAGFVLPTMDSLADPVQRFAALVESGGDPRPLATTLGATLLGPALAALPPSVARLVIVPDDLLHEVPFDALRISDGRLLLERFAVALAPSAAIAIQLWRRPSRTDPVSLLALADPLLPDRRDRSAGTEVETNLDAFREQGGLPRLRASAEEARAAAHWVARAELRLRERASEAFLKRSSLTGFRVLHLATHALVDARAVTRTAIALAPGDGEDGFVTPGELAALHLDADLVVLSACRTAGGVLVRGEGVQGLTAPLLAAGVRAIVATQWRIGDRSAGPLIDGFYRALARGLPAGEALRAAKLHALRSGAPPNQWAAFVLVGDPGVRVPLRER